MDHIFNSQKLSKLIRLLLQLVLQFTILKGFSQTGIITKDTTACLNQKIQLNAYPALSYNWYPNKGLSNTTIQQPVLTVNRDQTLYLETKNYSSNLVANGDFENGNTGFSSSYTFCNTGNCLYPLADNGYAIGIDASIPHVSFVGKDHTTGSGNFMILNGANPRLIVWKQSISVKPNTEYAFGTWISSLINLNTAKIRFSINGTQLGPVYNAPASTGMWEQFFITWNSGASNTAVIEIVDVLPIAIGNDFGLDDIFFGELITEKDSIQVYLARDKPLFTADSIGLCKETVTLDAGPGYAYYLWNTGESTQQIAAAKTGPFYVTAGQVNGCTTTDTVVVKNSLKMTTRPLVGCGDELVLLNNGVIESVRGKVIEFFSDSARTYQLNASVKISTRYSNQGKFNTAKQYKDYIDNLVTDPPTNGYGDTYLPVYRIVSNNIIFNGPKNDIAYKYTIRFFARVPGVYQFRTSFDFGRGGAIFLDGNIAAFNNQNMWWNGNWNAPGQTLQWSTTLNVGMHEILIYGLEDCCDGGGNAEYKAPGDIEFTPFSTFSYVKEIGTYYVTLHDPVTGCSSNGSINVTRSPKPMIQVNNPPPVCLPATIDLTQAAVTEGSDAPLNFNYYKDPEATVKVLDPTVMADSGIYYIVGQAQNNCYSDPKEVLVNIYSEPKADFSSSQKSGCTDQSVSFKNTIRVKADFRFHWNFGTGKIADTSNEVNPTFIFTSPGVYPVTLTVFSPGGCFDSVTDTINIYDKPSMTVTGPAQVCVGSEARFTGNSSGPGINGLKWIFGNGNISDQLVPPVQQFTKAGDFTIQLIGTNSTCADTSLFQLKVYPGPEIKLAAQDASICLGSTIQLFASDGIKFEWSPASGLNASTIADPVAKPARDTRYQVKVTTINNCVGYDSVQIIVNQPINITTSDDQRICAGNELQLTATGAVSYQWSPAESLSNPNSPDPIARPLTTTSYKVVGFGRDNCFTDTANVFLRVYPRPSVQAGNDTTIVAGTAIQLSILASNDVVSYRWSPGSGLSCTACSQPYANPAMGTIYTIAVKNETGCEATDQIEIRLNCSADNVHIPNAFSPNNDGQNDFFYPMGKGIRVVNYLRIYNRWGKLVFERKNFPINNRNAGWDGKVNSTLQSNQVYVYATQLVCENDQVIELKGNLMLIQ